MYCPGSVIMNKSISISEWHRLAEKGIALPVRIPLNGGSMYPLVRQNLDYVTVAPLKEKLIAGDIVLFFNVSTKRYVVHRAWKIENEKVLTWGDNCSSPDGWFSMDMILGKIVLIERGRRTIYPNPQKGLWWAKFWHMIRPLFYCCWNIKSKIVRRIKRLKV